MPDRLPGGDAEIIVASPGWRRAIPDVERLAARAVGVAGGAGSVRLESDRAVKRLNFLYRGRNKPTNVLTFPPAGPGLGGDIVLALETLRREARAAGRPIRHHFAHLLVHGALHLRGADHECAGDARRMEMREARLLARLRIPNPWKPR